MYQQSLFLYLLTNLSLYNISNKTTFFAKTLAILTKMLYFLLVCIILLIRIFDKASLNLYNEVTKLKEAIIMSNKNSIQYHRVGDYLFPNLILPPEEANITLGKWGMMYKVYLEKNKPVLFNSLLIQGKLYQHCAEFEKQARDIFDTIIEQMKESEGVTEQLKEDNQMEWICRMQNIESMAREIVYAELIYN